MIIYQSLFYINPYLLFMIIVTCFRLLNFYKYNLKLNKNRLAKLTNLISLKIIYLV